MTAPSPTSPPPSGSVTLWATCTDANYVPYQATRKPLACDIVNKPSELHVNLLQGQQWLRVPRTCDRLVVWWTKTGGAPFWEFPLPPVKARRTVNIRPASPMIVGTPQLGKRLARSAP